MRPFYLSAFLLLGSLAAQAQDLQATHPPRNYKHNGRVPLYDALADTTKPKPAGYIPADWDAVVVGAASPRWVIVKQNNNLYVAPAGLLNGYNAATIAAEVAADRAPIPVDAQTKLYTYEKVVEVPGLSKDQLYVRAHEWLAKAYHSANDVIQMQDKEAGRIIAKGAMQIIMHSFKYGYVDYTLSIYVKDGRYKYMLTNFTHSAIGTPNITSGGPLEQEDGHIYGLGGSKRAWQDIRREMHQKANSLTQELEAAMALKGAKDPSDF